MIRIDHLTKRFGRSTVVNDVTLDIRAGDSVALWGANGAGKTTLVRCTLGLLAFKGAVTIGGLDVRRKGKHARTLVGYVPQELGFYDDMRIHDAVHFYGQLKGVRIPRIDGVLDGVGLGGHGHKRIRELSGGMKQRLALAVALLGNPPVLMLDEVTASLDACGRDEFVALLARMASGGRTLLFASHRVEEVAALAGRVVMLERGSVIAEQSTADFVRSRQSHSTLHLHIHADARQRASDLLRARGFEPRLNGIGLLVPASLGQKAQAIQTLVDGQIAVDDFEIISGANAGRTSHD